MKRRQPTALLVDADSQEARQLADFLGQRGFRVLWAKDGETAHNVLDQETVDCMVCELRVERVDGLSLLQRARKRNPELCAVMMTRGADLETAVEAMREGASDFQARPLNLEKLGVTLDHGLSRQALATRVADLESRLDERLGFEHFTGHSRALQTVVEQIRLVAGSRVPVLISGEAGSGKHMVAQALHHHSTRAHERFVRIDLSALAEDVAEVELFGSERREKSGARRRGRVEIADGGTLFLDELSRASPGVQARILRLVQDQEMERVGGEKAIRVDVRVVAASDEDLGPLVASRRFRADLRERLSAVTIAMPPLRERRADLPVLVEEFLKEFNRAHGRRVTGISRAALEHLLAHDWPGNVRELKTTVEGMVVFAEGRRALSVSDLPPGLRDARKESVREVRLTLGQSIEEVERRIIEETLRWVGYDKPRAAETLGIGLRTLYRKLKAYQIV